MSKFDAISTQLCSISTQFQALVYSNIQNCRCFSFEEYLLYKLRKIYYNYYMNRQEFLDKRRKKFEELKKNIVDAAYEYYCSLTDEEKLISELEFARKLVKHMSMKISTARKYAGYLVLEYHVEFCKYKMRRPSYRICW